jgi:RNA polymerase sigma-70 factor (ECF subfamily)
LQEDWDHIIEGCKQQNPQHQEQLYRACYPAMIKLCNRYASDPDEAGALYNESMMKVFTNLQQYEGRGEWMAWIRRIVVNTCIDHCRRQVKFSSRSIGALKEDSVQVDPDAYNRLSAAETMRLLDGLPRNTALVFNLFVLEGYKHEEIGRLLGISAGTSKWHLSEGRRLLRNKLDTILKKQKHSNAV